MQNCQVIGNSTYVSGQLTCIEKEEDKLTRLMIAQFHQIGLARFEVPRITLNEKFKVPAPTFVSTHEGGLNSLCAILDPEISSERTIAFYEFNLENDTFTDYKSAELIRYHLLENLGVGTFLCHVKPSQLSCDPVVLFERYAGSERFDPSNGLSESLLARRSFLEAVAYAHTLSSDEKEKIRQMIDFHFHHARHSRVLMPMLIVKMILETSQNPNPLLEACIFSLPTDESVLGNRLSTLLKLENTQKREFIKNITPESYECILLTALLLGISDMSWGQLVFSSRSDAHDLYLSFANFAIQPFCFPYYPGYCPLLELTDLLQNSLTKQMYQNIQSWDVDKLAQDASLQQIEHLDLVLDRIGEIQTLVKNKSDATLKEIVTEIAPGWITTAAALKIGLSYFKDLESKIRGTANYPFTHTNLLTVSTNQAKEDREFRANLEKDVFTLMEKTIPIVNQFMKRIQQPIKQPFLNVQDEHDRRKFVGINCCGTTSDVLNLLLKSKGYQSKVVFSLVQDHAFIQVKGLNGYTLFVDPTYKQLFQRTKDEPELFPLALIGTAEEFAQFYHKHKTDQNQDETFYWVFNSDSKAPLRLSPKYFKKERFSHLTHLMKMQVEEILHEMEGDEAFHQFIQQEIAKKSKKTGPFLNLKQLPEFLDTVVSPFCYQVLKKAFPASSFEKMHSDPFIALTPQEIELSMILHAFFLKKLSFRVSIHSSTASPFTFYLRLSDLEKNKQVVIPHLYSYLVCFGEEVLDQKKIIEFYRSNKKIYFVGDLKDFQVLLNELKTEESELIEIGKWSLETNLRRKKLAIGMKSTAEWLDAEPSYQSIYQAVLLMQKSDLSS